MNFPIRYIVKSIRRQHSNSLQSFNCKVSVISVLSHTSLFRYRHAFKWSTFSRKLFFFLQINRQSTWSKKAKISILSLLNYSSFYHQFIHIVTLNASECILAKKIAYQKCEISHSTKTPHDTFVLNYSGRRFLSLIV